jgi:hypothetical protein
MTNTNDIVSGVYARLGTANIPAEITAGHMIDLANDRILEINTLGGLSVSGDSIPSNIVSPLKDLVTADVMARTLGIDIDTEIGIGTIKLAYRDQFLAESRMIDYFITKAEKSLNMAVGRRLAMATTIKVA